MLQRFRLKQTEFRSDAQLSLCHLHTEILMSLSAFTAKQLCKANMAERSMAAALQVELHSLGTQISASLSQSTAK